MEIVGGEVNHVLGATGLADEECGFVVGFDDVVDFGDLNGDFVGGGLVLGDYEGEFPFVAPENVFNLARNDVARDVVAEDVF